MMIEIKIKRLSGVKKVIGLSYQSNPQNIYFQTRFGIHTFGLKFPIDVLILNGQSKVVKIKKSLHPNQFLFWNPIFNRVIELPAGFIESSQIKLGNDIKLIFTNNSN